MKPKNLIAATLLFVGTGSAGTAQGIIWEGAAISPATSMSFETAGTQTLDATVNSAFGWRTFSTGLSPVPGSLIIRTASRNNCSAVGNGGNNSNAGFTTNQIIPGVNYNTNFNGEVHEFWDDPTPPITSSCFSNNKYIYLQARGNGSSESAIVGVVHQLDYTMQPGDVLVFRGWPGWKKMNGTPSVAFTFNVGLVPVGGVPLAPSPVATGVSATFPPNFSMNWQESITAVTATAPTDRVVLYFKAVMDSMIYYRFFLDDVNMAITAYGSGMVLQPNGGSGHDATANFTKGLMDESGITSLSVSPNPTTGSFLLSHGAFTSANHTIEVYNATGALVKQLVPTSEGTTNIDLAGSPNGAYLVKYTDGDRIETIRIMKE